jgi:hypothetical protein
MTEVRNLVGNGWNLHFDDTRNEVNLRHVTPESPYGEFVGRFKYARPLTNAKAFAKFLAANFTPAEYYAERATGKAPLTILADRGYLSPNTRRALGMIRDGARAAA